MASLRGLGRQEIGGYVAAGVLLRGGDADFVWHGVLAPGGGSAGCGLGLRLRWAWWVVWEGWWIARADWETSVEDARARNERG